MNDPIVDQIDHTLTNLRREVSINGITEEADALWMHALDLYRRRAGRTRSVYVNGREATDREAIMIARDASYPDLPAPLRPQAE